MSEQKAVSLGEAPLEIIDGDRGINYPKQSDFYRTGHCLFLNAGNVTVDGFNFSDCSFITDDKDRALRKGKLRRSDLILTTRGTVGNAALYDDSVPYEHIRINSGMVILRANSKELLPQYLYLILRSKLFHDQIKAFSTGSAQPQLPIRDIEKIEISIPSLSQQGVIVKVLGALDEKIALNHKMNRTLEAISQVLFKRWFVDFEFPGHKKTKFVDDLPEGWRMSKIGEELITVLGGTPAREKSQYWENGTIPWINSSKANEFRVIEPSELITKEGLDNSATKIMPEKTTVIAITGATLGQVSLLEISVCANQSIVGILPSDTIPAEFIYLWIKNNINRLISWQTGGAQQHINKNNVNDLELLCPSKQVMQEYIVISKPLFEQIRLNCFESRTLILVRDSLLPRLMSGRIRIGGYAQ